ncbi:MAG: ABC transporter permease [Chloroflexota bacterium]
MMRLLAAVTCDVRLQFRNGFYAAAVFVVGALALVVSQLPTLDLGWLLPALVSGNLIINTFYFVGGLVLLEKGEGSLEALVVTPLRTGEYLASKVLTLTVLSVVENVIVVALLYGLGFGVLPLVVGVALAAALYVLVGFVAVARYASINEYLLPSVVYTSALTLPLVAYLGRWEGGAFALLYLLLYLHPLQAPLMVMQAAFEAVDAWRVLYGVLYAGLWIGVTYLWSRRAFRRFVVARAGAG